MINLWIPFEYLKSAQLTGFWGDTEIQILSVVGGFQWKMYFKHMSWYKRWVLGLVKE